MTKFSLFILLFLIFSFCVPAQVLSQDAVRISAPPTVQIKIGGIEPLPPGVAKLMGFGSGAGGGGMDAVSSNVPAWMHAPSIVYPQLPEVPRNGIYSGSIFVACNYPAGSYPEVMLTSPSGKNEKIIIEDDFHGGCWEYYQTWSHGMELGEYSLVAKHAKGTLTHSWFVEYPPYPIIGLLSNPNGEESIQTRFLMGFEPEAQLTLRIYSPEIPVEFTEEADYRIPGAQETAGGYVATRIVTADENGAVIIHFSSSPSTPIDVRWLGFTIDGYQNPVGAIGSPAGHDYRVTKILPLDQSEKPYSLFQPDLILIRNLNIQIPSIWKGLTFKDIKSPGTVNYKTSLSTSEDAYLLNFNWCADTTARLAEILDPFELTVTINNEPISRWYIHHYNDGKCHRWGSVLDTNTPELEIVFHYTLSEDIFDGSNTYKAGKYFHKITATFR